MCLYYGKRFAKILTSNFNLLIGVAIMGLGGISIWQLLIILIIVVVLFGTKRLRNIGTDLGSAIRGFRNSIKDNQEPSADAQFPDASQQLPTQQPVAQQPAQPQQPANPQMQAAAQPQQPQDKP